MIGKKVGNPKKSSPKAVRIGRLVDYLLAPETKNANEKCVYSGARSFLTDTAAGHKAEMIALAQEAVRSKDTINHYVLSWRESEQPTHEHVERAVEILLDELGLVDHQVVYGLHADTDNIHLHLAVNRVHPESLKVIKPNKGFDKEAVHKAIARIEHEQGWQRETNGRYHVLENGELGREHLDPDKPRQPGQQQRDREHRTGEKSAQRMAIEDGAPIIKRAKSWEQLHQELAEKGLRYEKKGSGAIMWVGEIAVKASSVDRSASLSQLQKRLGVYQPSSEHPLTIERSPEPIQPTLPGWPDYRAARSAHYADKDAETNALRQRQAVEREQLANQQKTQREAILAGNWQGRGDLLNAMRSVLAADQAAEKLVLKERQRRERVLLRDRFPPYPDFETWLRQQQRPELAGAWRYRTSEPQLTHGETTEPPTPSDIRAYVPAICGREVHYSQKDDAAVGVAFIDKGREIDIHDWRNRDSVLAALQLSAQKWGRFTVTGNDDYQALCVQLAAEHGFQITNPELQQRIEAARQQIQQDRAETLKSEPLKAFERYADAVGAERYQMTSVRLRQDGSRQTFVLDNKEGLSGFTPPMVAQRMPALQRLQRRGEAILYTPLSATKHHVVIDAMNRSALDRLIRDGYQPCVILETRPGQYQSLITVPKLGTPHDQIVGQQLVERLNQVYGDPERASGVWPHPAPGFLNREQIAQREDGSYPEVRLLKAERRECTMTLALSTRIDAECQQQAAQSSTTPRRSLSDRGAMSQGATDVYQRHFEDIVRRQRGGKLDLSRVDAMIAVRLRVTGHDQSAIEDVIRRCAPDIRQEPENRDWHHYAQRTARYAYSAAGDQQIEKLTNYRSQWMDLEGLREDVEQNLGPEL